MLGVFWRPFLRESKAGQCVGSGGAVPAPPFWGVLTLSPALPAVAMGQPLGAHGGRPPRRQVSLARIN